MSGKSELKLTDDLIREALYLELEAVKAPPSDKIWQRIESGFDQTRPSAKRPVYSWSRLAAVAAACLVILFGSIHVARIIQFSNPAADFADLPIDSGEEVALLAVEEAPAEEVEIVAAAKDDDTGLAEIDAGETEDDLWAARAEPDLSPADWPLAIVDDLILNKTVILVGAGGPEYQGAIYSSSDAELLWVKSALADENLALFIDYLGDYINFTLHDMGETNGFTRLEAVELPGLAWQKDGLNQALLVISGSITGEDLKNIASGIEQTSQ